MKTLFFIFMMSAMVSLMAQNDSDEASIKKTISSYAKAGDAQDVSGLDVTLHEAYRLVWYSGKDEPFISDKPSFLNKFKTKEWGGDKRTVSVSTVQVFDACNASAKAILDGSSTEMRSLFTLVKVEGQWKVIGELVNATFK